MLSIFLSKTLFSFKFHLLFTPASEIGVVLFDVTGQGLGVLGGKSTHNAGLARIGMNRGQMLLHRIPIGKDLLTQVALEQTLTSVDSHVISKLLTTGEDLSTVFAWLST